MFFIRIITAALLLLSSQMCLASETVELYVTIKDHIFVPAELKAPAGKKIKLHVLNQDNTIEEFESHDLNREKIIHPHKNANIVLAPLKVGVYHFYGEFHPDSAKGQLVIE